MQRLALKLGTLSAVGLLSACANGPGFYSLPEAIMLAFPAVGVMNEARGTTPSGAYETAAYTDLMKHAEYEYVSMGDFKDAIYHARKAIAVAGGQDPAPQNPSERVLPADTVAEIQDAYTRLNAAYAAGGKTKDPEAAGVALGSFDCWIEQQEENHQPDHIAACRDEFYAALAKLEEAMKPEPEPMMPAAQPEPFVLFFAFDSALLTAESESVINQAVAAASAAGAEEFSVTGHADRAGSEEYNARLSLQRANAVKDALLARGIGSGAVSVAGRGESEPAVPTADGVAEQANRRVIIIIQ
jgi:OOP family OmpA-OmpF porin